MKAEVSLNMLAYTFRRLMAIMGISGMLAAIRAYAHFRYADLLSVANQHTTEPAHTIAAPFQKEIVSGVFNSVAAMPADITGTK